MTRLALDFDMTTEQRKLRSVVVEIKCLLPVVFDMAALTFFAKLLVVLIVFAVAADTGSGSLVAIKVSSVATIALGGAVCAA